MTRPDVAVVGAGVIGLATAWRVAQRGLAVTVFDPAPARGASWAAAGMLAPVTEVHYGEEALLRLNLAAAERYPSFAAELEEASGRPSGYRRCGALLVARDHDDSAALADLFAFQQELGLKVERLRSREARELEPALAPTIRGGIRVDDDHQVDNRALLDALLAACEQAGVTVRTETVGAVEVAGGRVRGVRLVGGEHVDAGMVVLAAGSSTAQIDGVPPLPVRAVKGQLLHLRGPAEPPLAGRIIRGLECYIVPRDDGRIVVGATSEERSDRVVTAGAVSDLLRAARELLPDVAELEFVEAVAGLRPATPDNAPLLGLTDVDGLIAAVGHYRNGVLLAPVTADALAELIATGTPPALVTAFGADRFAPAGKGP